MKPLGLLSIGSLLQENGYAVSLLDCLDPFHPALRKESRIRRPGRRKNGTGHFYKESLPKPVILQSVPRKYGRYGIPLHLIRREISRLTTPDVILVTSGMTYWYPGVFEIISLLKDRFPKTPLILGGIYATLCTEHARIKSGADEIVTGEGELHILERVDFLTGNHSDISRYSSLNDLPDPLYDLYPVLDSAAILTSRGCPFRCPFCASGLLAGKNRRLNLSHVIKTIRNLALNKGVRHFAFYDDALLYEKQAHLNPLLKEIVSQNLSVHFHTPNGIQPREVDPETACLMKEAGFQTLRLSYETVNPDRQKWMGSKIRDEDLVQAVCHLKEAGFDSRSLGSYVMMGLPGQGAEEVVESILFVIRLGIQVSLASFSPIPGTHCFQDLVRDKLIPEDLDPLLTNNSVFPLQSESFDYPAFIRLGTLAAMANHLLQRQMDPLNNPNFLSSVRHFKIR